MKRRQWRADHPLVDVSLVFLADSKAAAAEHLDHCFGAWVMGPDGGTVWVSGAGHWDTNSLKMIGWAEDAQADEQMSCG